MLICRDLNILALALLFYLTWKYRILGASLIGWAISIAYRLLIINKGWLLPLLVQLISGLDLLLSFVIFLFLLRDTLQWKPVHEALILWFAVTGHSLNIYILRYLIRSHFTFLQIIAAFIINSIGLGPATSLPLLRHWSWPLLLIWKVLLLYHLCRRIRLNKIAAFFLGLRILASLCRWSSLDLIHFIHQLLNFADQRSLGGLLFVVCWLILRHCYRVEIFGNVFWCLMSKWVFQFVSAWSSFLRTSTLWFLPWGSLNVSLWPVRVLSSRSLWYWLTHFWAREVRVALSGKFSTDIDRCSTFIIQRIWT